MKVIQNLYYIDDKIVDRYVEWMDFGSMLKSTLQADCNFIERNQSMNEINICIWWLRRRKEREEIV